MRLIDFKVQTFKVKTCGEKIYLERNGLTMKDFFTNSQVWLYLDSLIHYISFRWNVSMDIKKASFNSNLEEDIYMMLLDLFITENQFCLVCKLFKVHWRSKTSIWIIRYHLWSSNQVVWFWLSIKSPYVCKSDIE